MYWASFINMAQRARHRGRKKVTQADITESLSNTHYMVRLWQSKVTKNTHILAVKESELRTLHRNAAAAGLVSTPGTLRVMRPLAQKIQTLRSRITAQEVLIARFEAVQAAIEQTVSQQQNINDLAEVTDLMRRMRDENEQANPMEVSRELSRQLEHIHVQETLVTHAIETSRGGEKQNVDDILAESAMLAGVPYETAPSDTAQGEATARVMAMEKGPWEP